MFEKVYFKKKSLGIQTTKKYKFYLKNFTAKVFIMFLTVRSEKKAITYNEKVWKMQTKPGIKIQGLKLFWKPGTNFWFVC